MLGVGNMEIDSAPPKVFISYSWESEDHKKWVRLLAERLTKNGVDVRLDQWHIVPGQSLTQFMESEVQYCDFILVVCTKDYCRKSIARAGGVGYEQQIITGHIVAGMPRERFVPIVRDGEFRPGAECSIPGQFLGIYAVDMRDDAKEDQRIEDLLRAIFKQPALMQPSIGPRPTFVDATASSTEEDLAPTRLAILDIDGWHLLSGVASHHRWPETFEIPDERERRNLKEGDIVKLQFEISVPDDEEFGDVSSERMWVFVRGRSGPYFLGELDNVPACTGEQDHLKLKDNIVFLPEHVISIYEDGNEIVLEE
jgi:TIR domain